MPKNVWRTLVDIAMAVLLLAAGIFEFLSVPGRGILLAALFAALLLHLYLNGKKLLHPAARHSRTGAPARRSPVDFLRLAIFLLYVVCGLLALLEIGMPAAAVIHRVAWAAALALTVLHVLGHRAFLRKAWNNVVKKRPLPVLCTLLLCAALTALAACIGRAPKAPSSAPFTTPKPLPIATPTDDGAFHG